jgi:hypothetical protein
MDLIIWVRPRASGNLGLHNNGPRDIKPHDGVRWCYHAQGDNYCKWRSHRSSNWLLELLMHKPTFPRWKGLLLYNQIQQFGSWRNIHIHILGLISTIFRRNSQLHFPLYATSFSIIFYLLCLNIHKIFYKTIIKLLPKANLLCWCLIVKAT